MSGLCGWLRAADVGPVCMAEGGRCRACVAGCGRQMSGLCGWLWAADVGPVWLAEGGRCRACQRRLSSQVPPSCAARSPFRLPLDRNMERLSLQGATRAIDDYLEYKRIVGEDDGGKLFTPEEYEEYKKTMLPIRMQNRLFVSWRSPTGIDCKLIGPETLCFCTHRYKQHKTDLKELPKERPILLPCRVSKCQCKSYHYVPLNGSQPIRCRCKHFADDHSAAGPYNCKKCSRCAGFHSSFTCGCSQPAYAHDTVAETKEERLAQGKPVGHDVPYAAIGGLTGFSSLAEGYMRLDESGVGSPDRRFFEAPEDGSSHPFLRAYGPSSSAVTELPSGEKQVSNPKRSEEDDMAFFEKRYQERLQREKEQKRLNVRRPNTQRP